jgi:hypothetical protein
VTSSKNSKSHSRNSIHRPPINTRYLPRQQSQSRSVRLLSQRRTTLYILTGSIAQTPAGRLHIFGIQAPQACAFWESAVRNPRKSARIRLPRVFSVLLISTFRSLVMPIFRQVLNRPCFAFSHFCPGLPGQIINYVPEPPGWFKNP